MIHSGTYRATLTRKARRLWFATLMLPYWAYAAIPIRRPMVWLIRASQQAVSFVPFLLSLWLSSIYRSIIAGWQMSGMDSADERAALKSMLGDD